MAQYIPMLTLDLALKPQSLRLKLKPGLQLPPAQVYLEMKGLIQSRSCSKCVPCNVAGQGDVHKGVVCLSICLVLVRLLYI